MLADAYDAAIMTGAMVVDTHRVCQFALFRSVCVGAGGEGPLVNYPLRMPTL